MPIYEFKCKKCRHRFEDYIASPFLSITDIRCPKCGSENLEKLISAPSIGNSNKSASKCPDIGSSGMCNTCPMG